MVKALLIAALMLSLASAAVLLSTNERASLPRTKAPRGFVTTSGSRFMIDGRPFRFAGANVAVMYKDEDRARMPETLQEATRDGIRVVRVWASGEGFGPNDVKPIADFGDWPRTHPFRSAPNDWNEEAFVHLDHVLAEASRQNLRVQLTLSNWWRDTGGVTQYLRWAGINDAADDKAPFGINVERALAFYTNEETRRLYRAHVERIVTRRNTVTGILYRDDPTILGYELMNEAQAPTNRWEGRRAWMKEMSEYVKSLDPNHLVTPGIWGYRNAYERHEWLEEHKLPSIDYCDVHNYPRDDLDTFVDSPKALKEFIENRAAAAFSINKPLVIGEFGMGPEGYKDFSQAEWFHALFESSARAGVAGTMYWILTPDKQRGYGVTYSMPRDEPIRKETRGGAELFRALQNVPPPSGLLDASRHLIPRQFAFRRDDNDPAIRPEIIPQKDGALLYRFSPEQAAAQRFEKVGGGAGYIWGAGMGYVEYLIPPRNDWRKVGELVVRAHIQPVPPHDAPPAATQTRVTLFINNTDCGSRLVPVEAQRTAEVQTWRINSLSVRLAAARDLPLRIRFAVKVDADQPFGINISNWPEGYDAKGAKPVEVEVR